MITLAEIRGKQYDDNRTLLYQIYIPIFKAPGQVKDTILLATCSAEGGSYEPYNVGDVVYVSFVGNSLNYPVVLGRVVKQYSTEDKSSSYKYLNTLEVTDRVVLPENTTIGSLTFNKLIEDDLSINNIKDTLKSYVEVGGGYSFTQTNQGTSGGAYTALITGTFKGKYGTHLVSYVGTSTDVSVDGFEVEDWSSDNPLIIKNVTQIVFKSYTNTNIDTFTSSAIYSYGGTAMSSSNVPTYVNRILYLQKDFTISYKV